MAEYLTAATCLGHAGDMGVKKLSKTSDRRKLGDRRVNPDRREMPPRPEGRRKNGGRRVTDPQDV